MIKLLKNNYKLNLKYISIFDYELIVFFLLILFLNNLCISMISYVFYKEQNMYFSLI